MGVGYKLPLTYNVIKTTLKSTNYEAGKKPMLLLLSNFYVTTDSKREEPGQKLFIRDRPGFFSMRLPEKILWLLHCKIKSKKNNLLLSESPMV